MNAPRDIRRSLPRDNLQQSPYTDSREKAPDGRVKIIVDQREDRLFDLLLKKMGADVERRVLEVGDFLCSSRLAVERKSRADFEQSVIDGRLFAQLPNLVSNYERIVIVVEGQSDENRISRSALLGAYAAIIADFGASLMFTRDKEATAELVFNLAKHEQLARKSDLRVFAKRKSLTPSQAMRSIIEMLPLVGPKGARALLAHFGSVEDVISASEKDLSEVPGIGEKKAKLIRAILRHPYDAEE